MSLLDCKDTTDVSSTLDQAFEWYATFNELKGLKPLLLAIQDVHPETARQLESFLSKKLSNLPDSLQQQIKNLSFAYAEKCPLYMSQKLYTQLRRDIEFPLKSGEQLYEIVSHTIHGDQPLQQFKWMKVAAEKGSAEAQAFVGWCYDVEQCGCLEDRQKALYWYSKAAEQKNQEGLYFLDVFSNLNVPKTQDDARLRFSKANEKYSNIDAKTVQEHEIADLEFTIGNCYHRGYGVPVDTKRASYFYQLAAKKNHRDAQLSMINVDVDNFSQLKLQYARVWAEKGDARWQELLASLLSETDKKESTKWRTLAADQNNPASIYNLAVILDQNVDQKSEPNQQIVKVFQLFHKAADLGYLYACFALGKYIALEEKNKWDDMCTRNEQLNWIKFAANRGHIDSMEILGTYHYFKRDRSLSLKWLLKAASRGNVFASYYIGCWCQDEKQYDNAVKWYTMSVKHNNDHSMFNLGQMYYNGFVNIDKVLGRSWIVKSANLGNLEAKEWLRTHNV